MKRIFLSMAVIVALSCIVVSAQNFDAKLKRFIAIENDKYVPEVSRDEAVKLGFTANDYNSFIKYVEQLNTKDKPALTLPENLFLAAFLEFRGDTLVLAIPLEKALRAGATAEGYFQTLEVVRETEAFLNNGADTKDGKRRELKEYLAKYQRELLEFARRNPDSSAVKKFFTAPPMLKH